MRQFGSRPWLAVSLVVIALGHVASANALAADLAEILGLPAIDAEAGERPGSLVLDGGPVPTDDVAHRFVELAGGAEAKILLIPTAKRRTWAEARSRFGWWANLPKRSRAKAVMIWSPAWEDDEANAAALDFLDEATGVWMTGGDQARLEEWLVDAGYGARIRQVYRRGGVVGGTSAGMAIQSRPAILGGSVSDGRVNDDRNDVELGDGLGLLTGTIVEQHLDRPGRLRRIATVLDRDERHPAGIAVQEYTALIVTDNRLGVLGEGNAVLLLPLELGGYVPLSLSTGQRATLSRAPWALKLQQ